MPTVRAAGAVGAINGILYVAGGGSCCSNDPTVVDYDPSTDTWSTKTSISTPRTNLDGGVVNGVLYVVGGTDNVHVAPLATNEAFTPGDNLTWASGNTSVATISATGLATAGATAGSSTITATSGSVSGTAVLTVVSSDTTPPTTVASASPAANGAGWNKADVTVTLTATDNAGGSGVQSITYTLINGTQGSGATVPGNRTSFVVSTEGTTTVSYHARDNVNNDEVTRTLVIRLDKTAPALTVPANMTVNATSPSGAVVTFTPTATDAPSGVASLTSTPASGSTFPIGTTTVTVTATDTAGNISTANFSVTVVSPFPITIDATALSATSFSLNAGAAGSAPDARVVTTIRLVPGPYVFYAPFVAASFVFTVTPGGTVDYDSALDVRVSGRGTTTLTLISPDSTPPTTVASVSPAANGAGWNKANVTVTLTATDNTGGSGVQSIYYTLTGARTGIIIVTGSATSTLITAEGTTTVTYHARDNAGNVEGDQTVIVRLDKTAPALNVANITVNATSPSGAAATYTPVATDATSGVASLTSSPPSGSTFPIGTTTVTVTATDTAGNISTASFTVSVLSPAQQTSALITTVSNIFPQASNLLQNALNSLNGGNTGAACNQVGAFINQVQAQAGKQLTTAQANQLILTATQITGALGCS